MAAIRPETSALVLAARRALTLLYACYRSHDGSARVDINSVRVPSVEARDVSQDLVAALTPFGEPEVGEAIAASSELAKKWRME